MKNLIFIAMLYVSTTSFAQITFPIKVMKTAIYDFDETSIKTENVDGEIIINSDTTEITVSIKKAKYREKIGKLQFFTESETLKCSIYHLEEGLLSIYSYSDGKHLVTMSSDRDCLYFFEKK